MCTLCMYTYKLCTAKICQLQVLKRDRFSLVLKFLHLADNEGYTPKGQPGYDAIYKLRPFLEPFIANSQAAYSPNRELSVDEAMIGFKGRLSFIQYLPNKPTKWGMKAYVLADSVTGYVYNWRLYTGTTTCTCNMHRICTHIQMYCACVLNMMYTIHVCTI